MDGIFLYLKKAKMKWVETSICHALARMSIEEKNTSQGLSHARICFILILHESTVCVCKYLFGRITRTTENEKRRRCVACRLCPCDNLEFIAVERTSTENPFIAGVIRFFDDCHLERRGERGSE